MKLIIIVVVRVITNMKEKEEQKKKIFLTMIKMTQLLTIMRELIIIIPNIMMIKTKKTWSITWNKKFFHL